MYKYRMIQVPPNVAVAAKRMLGKAPDTSRVAAEYLETVVNQQAEEGWDFMRVDTVGVKSSPGCLAGLLGEKEVQATYYVITFRRAA